MNTILELDKMIYDNSLWLAIIAINMTVIGLTSLAETKKIIGVDYGKFLIKHYKVLGLIRIYYLLIIFASVNIVSLITMFTAAAQIRTFNLIVLLSSLIFAIYYFFSFILIENTNVKHQIYKDELLGMYYKSNDRTNFYPDIIVEMSDGWRTSKRLSSNVISYFNVFNNETAKAFEEVFGPGSLLYSNRWNIKHYWKSHFKIEAYDYSSKYEKNLVHISHEFFQLFRYSDLQEKWILEILRLFNKDNEVEISEYKIDNLVRINGHIMNFGKSDQLYSYKFIEYYSVYVFDAIRKREKYQENLIKKEKYLITEFSKFLFSTLIRTQDDVVKQTIRSTINKLVSIDEYCGYLGANTNLKLIFTASKEFDNEKVKIMMTDIYNYYLMQNNQNVIGIKEIKKILNHKEKLVRNRFEMEDIYG